MPDLERLPREPIALVTSEPEPDPAESAAAASALENPQGSMTRHAVSGVIWSSLQSWGTRVISTVVFVVIGRLVTPGQFGLVSLGSIFIEFGSLIAVSGFHRAIVQREHVDREHLDTAFWSSTGIGALLCVILIASAGWLADILDEPSFAPVIRALALTFVITGIGAVPSAILHRAMKFKVFALRQLCSVAAGGAVGIVLAVLGAGVWALVGQALTSAVAGTAIVLVSAKWRPRLRFSRRHWRDLASFGSFSLGIDMLALSTQRLDDLLVGVVLGTTALGYYSVAFRTFAIAVEVVRYSITVVFFPIFSRLAADRARAARALLTTTRLGVCVVTPVFVALAVLADDAVLGLFGPQWGPSVTPLRILAALEAIAALAGSLMSREVVLAVGRPRLELVRTAIVSVAVVASLAVGVRWGIDGVAWARFGVGWLIALDIYVMYLAIPFDVKGYVRAVLQPLPALCAMLGVLLGAKWAIDARPGSAAMLVLLCLIGGVTYLSVLLLTARSTVTEMIARVRGRTDSFAFSETTPTEVPR